MAYTGGHQTYEEIKQNQFDFIDRESQYYRKSSHKKTVMNKSSVLDNHLTPLKKSTFNRSNTIALRKGKSNEIKAMQNLTIIESRKEQIKQSSLQTFVQTEIEKNRVVSPSFNEEELKDEKIIMKALELDDAKLFNNINLTNQELLSLRFYEKLNILQAAIFHNAELVVFYLKERFCQDEASRIELISYREPNGGNQALHIAVIKGHKRIIESLISDFKCDPHALTAGGLGIMHCASQIDKGVLSLVIFRQNQYKLSVDQKDKFDCTPLHFAVLNAQYKCVECLLALGADPNAKNRDGQTALHIAVQRYIQFVLEQDEEDENPYNQFEDVKSIIKELLINGADRSIVAQFQLNQEANQENETQELTASQLLKTFQKDLPKGEFKSLNRILGDQKSCICLMIHRPLKKVERNTKFMAFVVIFNIINFLTFLGFYQTFYLTYKESSAYLFYYIVGLLAIVFFLLATVMFIVCHSLDPGYVRPKFNIIDLLQIANDKEVDLDNFCFYCGVINSSYTYHCIFCKLCVDKFDHHCTFIDNCLGYKNHKYFLIFLVSIFLYFICSLITTCASIPIGLDDELTTKDLIFWFFRLFSIGITLAQFIPLSYQMRWQLQKICKRDLPEPKISIQRVDNEKEPAKNEEEYRQRQSVFMSEINNGHNIGRCHNIKHIFKYKPPTQDQLRAFIMSNSERFSTFIIKSTNHRRSPYSSDEGNQLTSSDPGGSVFKVPTKINLTTSNE